MKIRDIQLLHNNEGTSNKIYVGILLDDGNYITVYGPRLGNTKIGFQNRNKKTYGNYLDKIATNKFKPFDQIISSKKSNGYNNKAFNITYKEIRESPDTGKGKEFFSYVNKSNIEQLFSELDKIIYGVQSTSSQNIDFDELLEKEKAAKANILLKEELDKKFANEKQLKLEKLNEKESKKLQDSDMEIMFF